MRRFHLPSRAPRRSRRLRALIAVLALVVALALAACERTADLIPGDGATPTPVVTATAAPGGATSTPEASTTPLIPGDPVSVSTEELAPSVVLVRTVEGEDVVREGVGVVVDNTARLLLTSFAVVNPVAPDASAAYEAIEVAIAAPGDAPVTMFGAEIVIADPTVDVAVLRVVSMLDGSDLDGAFDMPNVSRGDGLATAGESIRILSFTPAGGGESELSVTFASVTGLHEEIGAEMRTRLKTDAILPAESTGAPAFDAAGNLIGLATAERAQAGDTIFELRPLDLANPLVRSAQSNPSQRHVAAPERGSATGGPLLDADPWLSEPRFAAGGSPTETGEDLFGFARLFEVGTMALYYEFTALGLDDGALIEERWYLDDALQDHHSSTYVWDRGPAALVVDGIHAESAAGLEVGTWRLEIALDGELISTGTAILLPGEVPEPGRDVAIEGFAFASGVDASHTPTAPAEAGSETLLLFFDYAGMTDITSIRWLVFHRGRLLFQSPDVPWVGGERGRWWVGYRADEPLEAGQWQFEVHVGAEIYASPSTLLRAPTSSSS